MNLEEINVKRDLRIVFMGTPEFSVPVLEGLIAQYKIKAVVTQPDRLVGRKQVLMAPPVKEVANKNTILVLQPEKIKNDMEEIINLRPDLIITCAYGQILPKEILACATIGCINVHASLLPKLRGGAPIHHAIMDGYKKTGVTIMHMSPRMDEGDIISQVKIEITDTDTASTLHDKLSIAGRDLLLETLPSIIDGTASRTKQNKDEVTYGLNITREEEKINFSRTRKEIYNQIRGLNSWPGAYTRLEGKIMKVWQARISDMTYPHLLDGTVTAIYPDGFGVKVNNGEVVFQVIQPEGKGKMKATDFVNGLQDKNKFIGQIFE